MAGILSNFGNAAFDEDLNDGSVIFNPATGQIEHIYDDLTGLEVEPASSSTNRVAPITSQPQKTSSSPNPQVVLNENTQAKTKPEKQSEPKDKVEADQIAEGARVGESMRKRHRVLGRNKGLFDYDTEAGVLRAIDEASLLNNEYEVAVLDEETGEIVLYTYLADSGVYTPTMTFASQTEYANFLLSRKTNAPSATVTAASSNQMAGQENHGGPAPTVGAKIVDFMNGAASGLVAATGTILNGGLQAIKSARDLKAKLSKKEQDAMFQQSQDAAHDFAEITQADVDAKIDREKNGVQKTLEESLTKAALAIEALATKESLKSFREKLSEVDPESALDAFNSGFAALPPEDQDFVSKHIGTIESSLRSAGEASQQLAESKILPKDEYEGLIDRVSKVKEQIEKDLKERLKNFYGSDQKPLSNLADVVFGKMIGFMKKIGDFIKKTFDLGENVAQELRDNHISQSADAPRMS